METFIIFLCGACLSALTEMSKKFKISQTALLLIITLIIATIYVLFSEFNPDLMQKGIQMALSILGVASGIYMFITKYIK